MTASVFGKEPKVLIIDDDGDFGDMIAAIVASTECHAIVATDGLSGLRMARQFSPNLILCDFSLPDIDGGEVFRILQADPSMKEVPRVLMSGHGCPNLKTIPCDAFIAKPIDTQSLRRLVRAFTRLNGVPAAE